MTTPTATSRPGRLNWAVTIGDDNTLTVTVLDDAGDAMDLSGRTWEWRLPADGSRAAVDLDDSVDDTDATTGVLRLTLAADDSGDLLPRRRPWYLRDTTNDWTVLDGSLIPAEAGQAGVGLGDSAATLTVTAQAVAVEVTAPPSGGGGGAELSDATPQPLGSASAGDDTTAARGDHVHAMPTALLVGALQARVEQAVSGTHTMTGAGFVLGFGATGVVLPDAATHYRQLVWARAMADTFDLVAAGGDFLVDSNLTPQSDITVAQGGAVSLFVAFDMTAGGLGPAWVQVGTFDLAGTAAALVDALEAALTAVITSLAAEDISYTGTGLNAGLVTVGPTLSNLEGTLDRWKLISAYSLVDFDVSPYEGVPTVSQPTLSDGTVPVPDSFVALLDQASGHWCYHVNEDGSWTEMANPDVFDPPGNSYTVACVSPGADGDGAVFQWLNDDLGEHHRVNGENGQAWTGRWLRVTPDPSATSVPTSRTITAGTGLTGGGDLSANRTLAVSFGSTSTTVTPGDRHTVVGGQDEGSVVTATSATSLLDSTVTVSGTAGDVIEIWAAGRYYNNAGTTKRPSIILKLGSTDVLTWSPPAVSSSATDRQWNLQAIIRVEGNSDVNVTGQGIAWTGVTALNGTAAEAISSGVALDVTGAVESGGSQEVALSMLSIRRTRA